MELLLGLAVVATIVGMAVPIAATALDEIRTAMAARYLAGKIVGARLDAVQRSARIALRFERTDHDYAMATYADGNRNGVRTAEIADGTDPLIAPGERLSDHFAGVRVALGAGVPDLDGTRDVGEVDGLRIGGARILTLGPDGTATSGTIYIRGRRGQYAVRVLGATGRVRIVQYHPGAGAWIAR